MRVCFLFLPWDGNEESKNHRYDSYNRKLSPSYTKHIYASELGIRVCFLVALHCHF